MDTAPEAATQPPPVTPLSEISTSAVDGRPRRTTKKPVDVYVDNNIRSISRLVKKDRKKDLLGEVADWKAKHEADPAFATLYWPPVSERDSFELIQHEHDRIAAALGIPADLEDDDVSDTDTDPEYDESNSDGDSDAATSDEDEEDDEEDEEEEDEEDEDEDDDASGDEESDDAEADEDDHDSGDEDDKNAKRQRTE